jgi:hypothetical protein
LIEETPRAQAVRITQSAQIPTFPLDTCGIVANTVFMIQINTVTKQTDSKGRITLGEAFANRTMIVEQQGHDIVLRLARVIPQKEAWLYESEKALPAVRNGLSHARAQIRQEVA